MRFILLLCFIFVTSIEVSVSPKPQTQPWNVSSEFEDFDAESFFRNGKPPPVTPSCGEQAHYRHPYFGRRTSEKKCLDYMWDLKLRTEAYTRKVWCEPDEPDEEVIEHDPLGERIDLGHEVDRGDYPHMGAIGWRNNKDGYEFLCGCSLISHNFVVTAAYCSQKEVSATIIRPKPELVTLGDTNLIEPEPTVVDSKIMRIVVHPLYKPGRKEFDIALMQLDKDIEFNFYVQPACLWSYDYYEGRMYDQVKLLGWGTHETKPSMEVLKGTMDALDSSLCEGPHHNHQLCIGNIDAEGKLYKANTNCKVDSGGPIQLKIPIPWVPPGVMHFLVGVIGGYDTCGDETPRWHTRVSSFVIWIEEIVWSHPEPVAWFEPDHNEKAMMLPRPLGQSDLINVTIESKRTGRLKISLASDSQVPDRSNSPCQLEINFGANTMSLKVIDGGIEEEINHEFPTPNTHITGDLFYILFFFDELTDKLQVYINQNLEPVYKEKLKTDVTQIDASYLVVSGDFVKVHSFEVKFLVIEF